MHYAWALSLLGFTILTAILIAPRYAPQPNRTVRFIVTFGPGGGADNTARPHADHLARALGL